MVLNYYFIIPGAEIRDLEYQGTWFDAEITSWIKSFSLGAGFTTTCFSDTIFGGYNKMSPNDYFQRTYNNLPSHNLLYLSFEFFRIDSWDPTEDKLIIVIDGTIYRLTQAAFSSLATSSCGSSGWNDDLSITIIYIIAHSSSSLTVRFQSGLSENADNESPGIRELNMVFKNNSGSETFQVYCIGANKPSETTNWPCGSSQFLSGTCTNCNAACKSCYGSSASHCFSCADGYYYVNGGCYTCHSTCRTCAGTSSSDCTSCKGTNYLFPDNTCRSSCASGLVGTGGPPYTCNCASGYLHSDEVCNSCVSPFVISGSRCLGPCSAGLYYYANGSCLTTCSDRGFSSSTAHTHLFCNFACTTSQFLLRNNSCLSVCPYPFSSWGITGRYFFCEFPCTQDSFFYFNETCKSDCTYPLIARNLSLDSYCHFPCRKDQYWLVNGTCMDSCPAHPFLSVNISIGGFCHFSCARENFYYSNGSCLPNCLFPLISQNISVGGICNFPCNYTHPFYYYNNQTCMQNCSKTLPFYWENISIGVYCQFYCEKDEYYYINQTCSKTCPDPFLATNLSIGGICDFPCARNLYRYPNSTCLPFCSSPNIIMDISVGAYCILVDPPISPPFDVNTLVKVIRYIMVGTMVVTGPLLFIGAEPIVSQIFIGILQNFYFVLFYNVQYPDVVRELLGVFGIGLFNFLPNPITWVTELPKLSAPKNFEANDYKGLYLENQGDILALYCVLLGSYLIAVILVSLFRLRIVRKYCKIILRMINPSSAFRIFDTFYMDTLISCWLQILCLNFSNDVLFASSVLALVFLGVCLIFPIVCFRILDKFHSNSLTMDKFKIVNPLVQDFDIHRKKTRLFFFYTLVKRFIHASELVLFYYVPVLQTMVPLGLNLLMIILIARYQPHNKWILNVFDGILEIGYFILHSAVFSLAYLDAKTINDMEIRYMYGYIMIGSIVMILLFCIINIWRENWQIFRILKQRIKIICKKQRSVAKVLEKAITRKNITPRRKYEIDQNLNSKQFKKFRKEKLRAIWT